MIKKTAVLMSIFLISATFVLADSWDDFSSVDRMWDGQKSITNKEFEQVMEKLEEKTFQAEEKQKEKKIRKLFGKGKTLHNELNVKSNEVSEIQGFKDKEEGVLINIPVQIFVENNLLEKGFYKVLAEKDEESGKFYVNFYQSQFHKAKLEVNETSDDFGEEKLDFAKIVPYNDSFVKMIFGCIDFNAYAYIPYTE